MNITVTARDFFAALAPAVPSDFPWESTEQVVEDDFGGKRLTKVQESAAARQARWAWFYADMMMKGRNNEVK